MLTELRVTNLGVIQDVTVVLRSGMTALTGETGAGKTLLVDAISLLLGGPADPSLVRPGSAEAVVEGRFSGPTGDETILRRVVPASGRSRAYIDERMASAAQLAEVGESLVDMHGQHSHQALMATAAQRALLDRFGGISTQEAVSARRALRQLAEAREAIGGDPKARAREIDLLRFQVDELDSAGLESADEDERLRDEEETLSAATSLRQAAEQIHASLTSEDGICDRLGSLASIVPSGKALASIRERLSASLVELSDVAQEARLAAESLEDDPDRLAWIGARRNLIADLRRKYGDSLEEVIAFRDDARNRIAELESHDQRASELDGQIQLAEANLAEQERLVLENRLRIAPSLSEAVEARLRELAMPRAKFLVEVGREPPGDSVTWMLGANPGEPVLALTKVASGGELARTMLAARLVVGTGGPGTHTNGGRVGATTIVFDEVDAGIGGEAAVAVGRALASLSSDYQVLVVTHLPQVAAFADQHLVVQKRTEKDRTVASVEQVEGQNRVVELSRMLSGSPGSLTARRHAEELLRNTR
ncbi:MAG TPA: DNA repair protein RecN [Acidimicrobiales bacterium]